MESPRILIWRPEEENDAGHVALKTDKYYISFWPTKCLKDGAIVKYVDGMEFLLGVGGSVVLNQKIDRENEGDCDPDVEYNISEAVSNEDINSTFEEILQYNGINPKYFTIQHLELTGVSMQCSLAKTQYSFSAQLVSGKEEPESLPFYHKQQSCVSLVFNLIQVAWLKHHPDRPIPIAVPGELKVLVSEGSKEFVYRVPWFEEEIVKPYLITAGDRAVNNVPVTTTNEAEDVSVNLIEVERLVKYRMALFSVLAVLFYFCPIVRYPIVFAGFYILGGYSKIYLILNLFFMLLVYQFQLGIFYLIIIMHCCHFFSFVMWIFKEQMRGTLFQIAVPNFLFAIKTRSTRNAERIARFNVQRFRR
jgi:hypothetical protein